MHYIKTLSIAIISLPLLFHIEYVQCAYSSGSSSSSSYSSSPSGPSTDVDKKISNSDDEKNITRLMLHWFKMLGCYQTLGTDTCQCKHLNCLYHAVSTSYKRGTTCKPSLPDCLQNGSACQTYSAGSPRYFLPAEGDDTEAIAHNFSLQCSNDTCASLLKFYTYPILMFSTAACTIAPDFFKKTDWRHCQKTRDAAISNMRAIYQDILHKESGHGTGVKQIVLTAEINRRIMQQTYEQLKQLARNLYQQAHSGSAGSSSSASSHSSTSSMLHHSSASSSSPSCFSSVKRSRSQP